jgi:hypothetical protein
VGSGGRSAHCGPGAPESGAAPSGGRLRPGLAALDLTADSAYAAHPAVSLAMLTTAVAGLRAAQQHAAQAAAARRAAEHLRRAIPNHPPGPGRTKVRVRAADAARTDFPAGLTVPGQASPTTTHRAEHPESGPQRAVRDRRRASPRSVARAPRGVAFRPDFCRLITARFDDKLMTNDLQASSKIAELACDLRGLVGGTRLELVTSSVSGKRSPN